MHIKFNLVDEFCTEVEKELAGGRLHDRIVRVTKVYRQGGELPLTEVSVVATARVGDTVLRLDRTVGRYLQGDTEARDKVETAAEGTMQALTDRLSRRAEIRAGLLEP